MMYFIPWVVFLLLVILSVPIASWMDKRRLQAAYRRKFEAEDAFDDPQEAADSEAGILGDDDDDDLGAPTGAGSSTGDVRPDGDEPRGWQVLQGLEGNAMIAKFPDFDVAYLKAAYPSGNSGDHASARPRILEQGLQTCHRRSWLLGRLSAYSVWNREAEKGFQYAVNALLAARGITDAPGDLVGCLNLLVPVFHASGHSDVADKLQDLNPGYEESPEMQRAINAAVKSLMADGDDGAIASAADSLRAKTF